MANTKKLSKDERKKTKRAARKKIKAEKPKKPRDYARGSKKRKVKKLIEEEDERKPLTDDQLAAELQRQGIQVTRRTVAKYREDMQIPSTHQRRVR